LLIYRWNNISKSLTIQKESVSKMNTIIGHFTNIPFFLDTDSIFFFRVRLSMDLQTSDRTKETHGPYMKETWKKSYNILPLKSYNLPIFQIWSIHSKIRFEDNVDTEHNVFSHHASPKKKKTRLIDFGEENTYLSLTNILTFLSLYKNQKIKN